MTWYQRRGSKYKNKRSSYNGIQYHSKAEAGYAEELDLLKKAKEIKDWDRQVRFSLDVNGVHIANYYVDFEVIHADGTKELVEVKGRMLMNDPVWRMKRKLLEATFLHDNPDVKYTVVTV